MQGYPPFVCPHTVTHNAVVDGDFVGDGQGHARYVVKKTEPKEIPCRGTKFEKVGHFDRDSGIDPRGIKVRCLSCGQESYIFPVSNATLKTYEVKLDFDEG